ncbi:MAG: hypothetical protein Q4A56_02290 [Porphyromonadaceae bacterium]|nr:hypothetical protein [Porphyromonadaceae bacterium]
MKIDSLNIDLIVVFSIIVDLNGKSGIDRNCPMQILIFSSDGK